MGVWMGGFIAVEAVLRIAYLNQKKSKKSLNRSLQAIYLETFVWLAVSLHLKGAL